MTQRIFSPKCIDCRQRAIALTPVLYCAKISHDGREYNVAIPALVVPKCGNCGSISLDDEANKQIDLAFRGEAKLLTSEQIRAGRKGLGFNQQAFADLIGVAVSTLSRWETGAQIQQRSLDRLMRLAFEVPDVRRHLEELQSAAKPATTKPSVVTNTVVQATTWEAPHAAQDLYGVAAVNGQVLTITR